MSVARRTRIQNRIQNRIQFGQPRRIRRRRSYRAKRRINHIPPELEFRNQQVASSILAGGSIIFRNLQLILKFLTLLRTCSN
jgi:hypothetical protein